MGEVKFRIFDKKENKFLIKNQRLGRGDINGLFCVIIDLEEYSLQFDNPDEDRYIFLQYTGIKDKNGREIYEGDIVEYKSPYERRIKAIASVKWINELQGSFGVKDKWNNIHPLYTITANSYIEVIGNIYENNDLLGDE